jgi:ribosomal protein S18 acetylase RimI-like enzyme
LNSVQQNFATGTAHVKRYRRGILPFAAFEPGYVQPGYYEPGTYQLGNYFGIRQQNKLVAIAGERMRLDGLTEISAICTDPDYAGRKYAQQLIAALCQHNLQQGLTPFLHVIETNERAIRLYEYMGFVVRRTISFWQIQAERPTLNA